MQQCYSKMEPVQHMKCKNMFPSQWNHCGGGLNIALGQNMANFWCEQLVQGNQSTNLLNFIAPLVRCSIEPSQHVSGTFPQAVKRIA